MWMSRRIVGGARRASRSCASTFSTIPHWRKMEPIVLHLYEHCPFCVRVQLALGHIHPSLPEAVGTKVYGYGDVEGPTSLIGKKMLPVLEYDEQGGEGGARKKSFLAESLTIIQLLDQDGVIDRHQESELSRPELQDWLQRSKEISRQLVRPRMIKGVPIRDFATEEDVAYVKNKHAKQGFFDYEDCENRSEELKKDMNVLLQELSGYLHSDKGITGENFSMDDIFIFPDVRNLTVVDGLVWPENVWKWMENVSKPAGLGVYEGIP